MSKKLISAKRVSEHISLLKCPFCDSRLAAVEFKSLTCSRGHAFDFARQGYLNFMARPVRGHYDKELFAARHEVVRESDLFNPMHEAVAKAIEAHAAAAPSPLMIADLGCGEGSHLQKILEAFERTAAVGVGLDISKEGIRMAAQAYDGPIWLVGDLAAAPLANQAFHVILNILSPSNYREFKRILAPKGLAVKVVPRPHYLKELREFLFPDGKKRTYSNQETVALFQEHFRLKEVVPLRYTRQLSRSGLFRLLQMTPLAWSADPARTAAFANREAAEITVDLDILVGRKN